MWWAGAEQLPAGQLPREVLFFDRGGGPSGGRRDRSEPLLIPVDEGIPGVLYTACLTGCTDRYSASCPRSSLDQCRLDGGPDNDVLSVIRSPATKRWESQLFMTSSIHWA